MSKLNNKLTINDIAKSVGVSKTTISRYLNGKYEYMSDETKARIKNVIELTKYKPSNIARSLKSNATKLIGLVVADIESPFVSTMLKSTSDVLIKEEYNTIIVNSDNDYNKEVKYIEMLLSQRVDGLIVNTTKNENPFLVDLANKSLPIVLADRFLKDYKLDISYVECEKSIYEILNHLDSEGFKKVYFLTQPYSEISPRFLRVKSFLSYYKNKGDNEAKKRISVVEKEEIPTLCNIKSILKDCEKDEIPPAIFCANSTTLIYAINVVKSLNLEMPRDVAVCGFDDWGILPGTGYTSLIENGVTALVTNPRTIGENSASMLLSRIDDKNLPKRELPVASELVVRNSTLLKK